MRHIFILLGVLCGGLLTNMHAQETIDYSSPREYIISSLEVESNSPRIDKQFVKILSGLEVGRRIKVPGDDISQAIQKLWKEKVFSNIKIYHTKAESGKIDLVIYVEERPRLSKFSIRGVRKSEADDIRERVKLYRGEVVTEYLLKITEYKIKDFYSEKGFLDTEVKFTMEDDTTFSSNAVIMRIEINKNEKVKVERITVEGNKNIKLSKIRRKMKDALIEKSRVDVGRDILNLLKGKVKWKDVDSVILEDNLYLAAAEYFTNSVRINLFRKSKYVKEEVPAAKDAVIAMYNAKGYRDAKFVKDSIYLKDGSIHAEFIIEEGRKYYVRHINWVGNKRYRSGQLDTLLAVKRGDVYNREKIEQSLRFNPSGMDISALYQDIGYLFFNVEPYEILIEGDSVDLEMRIYEGKQARINKIIITGNSKTSDHVILREIRCNPGDLFSRSDIVRSQQALAQLGFFDAQAMDVRPIPNPADGTVDLEFVVAEAPSDQIELSGGWGAGQLIGTLGLTFNNFSLRNIFKKKAWTPLPSGDGQRLQIRAQSNGPRYQSYNFSFTEPWLGGKNPISFSLFVNHTAFEYGVDPNITNLKNTAAGISIGRQLKWPDDYFSVLFSLTYQRYDATNYRLFTGSTENFTGSANNLTLSLQLQRNSVDDWIYPTSGSTIIASAEITPPYSSIAQWDLTNATLHSKYEWLEYHKWKLQGKFFVPLTRNKKFVMMARGELGFLGYYNSQLGLTPFERFFLGGDGLSGFNIDGRDIISLRGYQNMSLTPGYDGNAANAVGGAVYSKYTVEFRYLISPNPQAKIFALAFLEAGNAWDDIRSFTPFKLNRSAGVGVRIFLPMFGLLGVDYGWGFDPVRGVNESQRQKGVFHFMIGQQF
ncbi:MAG: BamA/TamA family outer membrane protein [Candidatus Competibacteraceae bacterium]|nr:BamA/TamA family outer membrane protein [Candidatus Competibacteraceae bacterium]